VYGNSAPQNPELSVLLYFFLASGFGAGVTATASASL
jgi:hypothetical protein